MFERTVAVYTEQHEKTDNMYLANIINCSSKRQQNKCTKTQYQHD